MKEPIQTRLLKNLQTPPPTTRRRRVYQAPTPEPASTPFTPQGRSRHSEHSPLGSGPTHTPKPTKRDLTQRYRGNTDTQRPVVPPPTAITSPPAQPRAQSYTEVRALTATVPPPSPSTSAQKRAAQQLALTVLRPRPATATPKKLIQIDDETIATTSASLRQDLRREHEVIWEGETRTYDGPSSISPQVGASLIRRARSLPPVSKRVYLDDTRSAADADTSDISSCFATDGSFASFSLSQRPP